MHVHVYAIDINEVRDWFGAPPPTAARLRGIASDEFRADVTAPRAPGLLSRLGPLFRRDPWAPVVPVDHPAPSDVETLVNGQFVAPERLAQAWRVVQAWLTGLSAAHATLDVDAAAWQGAEFELARCGLPSSHALSRLWGNDLALPLRGMPGLTAGFSHHQHVVSTLHDLLRVRPDVGTDTAAVVDTLSPVLKAAGEQRVDVVGLVRA